MPIINIKDFTDWREKARACLKQHLAPHEIEWRENHEIQNALFSDSLFSTDQQINSDKHIINVPKAFIPFAEKISYHRDPQKWSLLYTALWRIVNGEKHLLEIKTDPIMHKLFLMRKAVGRDIHKMKAFVRFTQQEKDGQEYFTAWYEPDHKIIQPVVPFFQKRFSTMQWSIFTPDGAAHWDGNKLQFSEADNIHNHDNKDNTVDLWQKYYGAIFNPARIKIKAMCREMPRRFWKNMPETLMIPHLLQGAPQRVAKMIKQSEKLVPSDNTYIPKNKSLASLKLAAAKCQACPLHQCATQTVFGLGTEKAALMIIGEQPGNDEDLAGVPFIGPAGQLLNQILDEAKINRDNIYLTNAVKHFKFKLTNKRRLHASPNVREINACKPWLEAEISAIQPKVILCLGLTAVRAVFSHNLNMKELRGKCLDYNENIKLVVSYHPSAILRMPDPEQKSVIHQHLLNDLRYANDLAFKNGDKNKSVGWISTEGT